MNLKLQECLIITHTQNEKSVITEHVLYHCRDLSSPSGGMRPRSLIRKQKTNKQTNKLTNKKAKQNKITAAAAATTTWLTKATCIKSRKTRP